MRFPAPFIKLPITFSGPALLEEVRRLPANAWVPHATGFPGNDAVRLVTPGGQATDEFVGPMRPTGHLALCPYIMQVMSELGGVWGRSRLMGLGPGAEVPEHVDSHYHWRTHLRIHVPVMTNQAVKFTCGGETVHMAAGECWLFDSFRWHEVHNRGTERRVHLVLDTVLTEDLWDLIEAARVGSPLREHKPDQGQANPLKFERINVPAVMSPWEMGAHLAFIRDEAEPSDQLDKAMLSLERFAAAWTALWAQFGTSAEGAHAYRSLIRSARKEIAPHAAAAKLKNGLSLLSVLDQIILLPAVNLADTGVTTVQANNA